jgi:hypothetical protein
MVVPSLPFLLKIVKRHWDMIENRILSKVRVVLSL